MRWATEPDEIDMRAIYEQCVSAQNGDSPARIQMGNYYRSGWGPVVRDEIEAYKWYLLAARNGSQSAPAYLKNLSQFISDEDILIAQDLAESFTTDVDECLEFKEQLPGI